MTDKRRVDLMVDLETLGLNPGCVILEIGVAEFDPESEWTGSSARMRIRTESCLAAGLSTDSDTVAWWAAPEQAEARAVVVDALLPKKMGLGEALAWLRRMCAEAEAKTSDGKLRIWANGPQSDIVWLEAAWRALWPDQKYPWPHGALRDVRTILDAAGVDKNSIPLEEPRHVSTTDCLWQARAVQAAYRKLREKGDSATKARRSWSFDDTKIGRIAPGGTTLMSSDIYRPGLTNRTWYRHAGEICRLLNAVQTSRQIVGGHLVDPQLRNALINAGADREINDLLEKYLPDSDSRQRAMAHSAILDIMAEPQPVPSPKDYETFVSELADSRDKCDAVGLAQDSISQLPRELSKIGDEPTEKSLEDRVAGTEQRIAVLREAVAELTELTKKLTGLAESAHKYIDNMPTLMRQIAQETAVRIFRGRH